MKIIRDFTLASMLISLVGCGDSSSVAPQSATSSVREAVFSDTAVTSFTQTGGVASYKPSLMERIIPSAYAVSGNIRCVEGNDISFQLTALGADVQVDTTCNNNIDLSIRQRLLESLASKRLLLEYAGGADVRSQGRAITFGPVTSFWGTYRSVSAGLSNTGHNEDKCRDKYTFNETNGQVTIEHDVTNSLLHGADSSQYCLNSEFPGATADDYKKVLNYRFKDGKLEFDPDGTDFTVNSDYNRLCIDNLADGICD